MRISRRMTIFLVLTLLLSAGSAFAEQFKFQADGEFHYFGVTLASDSVVTITPKFPVGCNDYSRLAFNIDTSDKKIETGGSPNSFYAETWYKGDDGTAGTPTPLLAGSYSLRVQDLTYGHDVDLEVVIDVAVQATSVTGSNEPDDSAADGTTLVYGMNYTDTIGFKKLYNNYGDVYTGVADYTDYYIFTPTEDGELKITIQIDNFNAGYPKQNGYITAYISSKLGYNTSYIPGGQPLLNANGQYVKEGYGITAGTDYYLTISSTYGAWCAYSLDTKFTAASPPVSKDCSETNLIACDSTLSCAQAGGIWSDGECKSGSSTIPGDQCATYNLLTDAIYLPCVWIGSEQYWVEISFSTSLITDFGLFSGSNDCSNFNAGTSALHIPCIAVGSDKYRVDLQLGAEVIYGYGPAN